MAESDKTMNTNILEQAQQIQMQFEEKQLQQIQYQLEESNLKFPNKINVIAINHDESKTLRTSNTIISYLFKDLNGKNANHIASFQELSKRIHSQVLNKMRRTGCITNTSLEADFIKPLNQDQCESLNLRFKLKEDNLLSGQIGLSIDQKQRNIGLFLKPQFKNMFGQCETIAFRLRRSYFDFNQESKLLFSLSLPFITPDSFVQEFEVGLSNRRFLNNFGADRYKARSTFYSVKDPRWKFCLQSTFHGKFIDIHSQKEGEPQAFLNRIMNKNNIRYQNLVFKTSFTDKSINQKEYNTKSITKLEGTVGYGSNKSVFYKAKLYKQNQRLIPMFIGNGLVENRFQAGYVYSKDNLSQYENFTLVNQPSYDNIDLNDKNVISESQVTFGNRYFITNQFKYYLLNFPILSKIKIHPFLHAFAAFVPTDMNVKQGTVQDQAKQLIGQNLRLTAGAGLTFEINSFDKVDFTYSFAEFFPKENKDAYNKIQFSFYS